MLPAVPAVRREHVRDHTIQPPERLTELTVDPDRQPVDHRQGQEHAPEHTTPDNRERPLHPSNRSPRDPLIGEHRLSSHPGRQPAHLLQHRDLLTRRPRRHQFAHMRLHDRGVQGDLGFVECRLHESPLPLMLDRATARSHTMRLMRNPETSSAVASLTCEDSIF